MNHDINVRDLKLNCFRESKVPGEFMLQMRVPGGVIDSKYLDTAKHIAQTWGNGLFHFGTRQTFDMPGIKYEDIPTVNAYIQDFIQDVEVDMCGVNMNRADDQEDGLRYSEGGGYPTIGSRNIVACIGNQHCIKANINTTRLARKLEKVVFPNNYNIKLNISGCPNDCSKATFSDFGVIGTTRPNYHTERCIGCAGCVRKCKSAATRVLTLEQGKINKDWCCCTGCGECVAACPTSAWTRSETPFFHLYVGGRSGKQTGRAGKMFIRWATEDVIVKVLSNWHSFASDVMENKPRYVHGGHLMDAGGYTKFKRMMLDGVELNPEALVAQRIFWAENEQRSNFNLKTLADHPSSGLT